jgi:AraC-like DNA-binding protein
MVSRLEFSTRDPERALPVLNEFFPQVRMSNPRGNFAFELDSAEAGSISMVHYHLQSPTSLSSVDMSGTLTVGQVDAGNVALSANRRSIDTARPWIFPQSPVRGEWDEVTITALAISSPGILRFARAQLGDERFHLKFTGVSPTDMARSRQWVALTTYLRIVFAEDTIIQTEIAQANAFSHVAAVILATFPNNFMDAIENGSDTRVLPSAVRRAVAFMEENAQLPISVEDIASAARLSVRGLQYAFRTTLETTPTAYLRRVRLEAVHRELQLADRGLGGGVIETAASWGFSHPGRFAKQYRAAYGVSPRQTFDS